MNNTSDQIYPVDFKTVHYVTKMKVSSNLLSRILECILNLTLSATDQDVQMREMVGEEEEKIDKLFILDH